MTAIEFSKKDKVGMVWTKTEASFLTANGSLYRQSTPREDLANKIVWWVDRSSLKKDAENFARSHYATEEYQSDFITEE